MFTSRWNGSWRRTRAEEEHAEPPSVARGERRRPLMQKWRSLLFQQQSALVDAGFQLLPS